MKLKNVLIVMVAVSMAFVFAVTAQARPVGKKLFGLRNFLELKLSDSQQAEMVNIITKYQDQRESLRSSMMEARNGLQAVLEAEQFNEEQARKAFQKASALREEMFVVRGKMMGELKAVLTPEQVGVLGEPTS